MKQALSFIKKRKKSVAFSAVALATTGALVSQQLMPTVAETRYVLAAAETSTLMTTVTGSGQVQGEAEISVDPEISGKITSIVATNGDYLEEGDVIAYVDATEAQKNVRDTQLQLRTAQLSYNEATAGPDELELLQAETALAKAQNTLDELLDGATASEVTSAELAVTKAQRSLDQAQRDLDELLTTSDDDLADVADDGYAVIAESMTDLSRVLEDVEDFMGTSFSKYEYLSYYELILNDDNATEDLLSYYETANASYQIAQGAYRASDYDSSLEEKLALIVLVQDAAKDTANAVNEVQTLLHDLEREGYETSVVSEHIDDMLDVIPQDVSTINQVSSSLSSSADQIEELTIDLPYTIADAEDAVSDAQTNLQTAQEDLAELLSGAEDFDIQSARADVEEKELALADLQDGLSELEQLSEDISLQERKDSYADALEELEKYVIRAPISGTLANLDAYRGQQASSAALGTIITDQLTATISLNEVDVAKVSVGDKVTLTFDALEELAMTGKVVDIAFLATSSQGVVSYDVTIAFDTKDDAIRSGMSVNATIITEVAQNALTVSSSAITTQGDSSYVQVLESYDDAETGSTGVTSDASPTLVPVTLGISNDTDTQILEGITAGTMVVTRTITGESTSAVTPTTSSSGSLFGGTTVRTGGSGGFSGGPPAGF